MSAYALYKYVIQTLQSHLPRGCTSLLERDVGKERITKMVPFKYFFWSALFGGIIGGICGVMLTFKIYVNGNEEPEEPEEDPNEEEPQPAVQEEMILVREPVEHDERTERSY